MAIKPATTPAKLMRMMLKTGVHLSLSPDEKKILIHGPHEATEFWFNQVRDNALIFLAAFRSYHRMMKNLKTKQ